jgi:hypothetical protein
MVRPGTDRRGSRALQYPMSDGDRQARAERATTLQAVVFAKINRWTAPTLGIEPSDERRLRNSWERHKRGESGRPVLFPFRELEDGPTAWFACAEALPALRALQDEMRAFLGPSFVEERSQERAPDSADHHVLPAIAASGWLAIRFDAVGPTMDAAVLKMWRIYDELNDRRPRRPAFVPSTVNQLRAAFDRALLARDESGALSALSELRERFGVSAENRQFLDIRLQVAFERWDAVVRNPLLSQLMWLRLPQETYGDVMQALYRALVQPSESRGNADEILRCFRDEIAERAQPLFKSRRNSQRLEVLKSFLLHELLQEKPQAAICEQLLCQLPIGAFGKADAALRDRIANARRDSGIEGARLACDEEQYERAWDLFFDLADSVDVFLGLIACARELEDPGRTSALLTRLSSATDAIRREVEQKARRGLAKLRAGSIAAPLTDALPDQFKRLPNEQDDAYVNRWREYARSIDVGGVLAQSQHVEAASERLLELTLYEPAVFDRVYPAWHELFIERAGPSPSWVPLYLVMLDAIKEREVLQRTQQELLHQVLVAIVDVGDDEAYRRSLKVVGAVFEKNRSPRILGWALDVCDSLSQRRVRDADARMRFLVQVVQACQDFASRLERPERELVQLLAQEADLPTVSFPGTVAVSSDIKVDMEEEVYRVALYSLEAGATRRAIQVLKAMHPRWVIDTNTDQVCTAKLKALAQNADVFVFAWRCSSHAAYACVKASSRKENLIMARGVGTASLVAAATEQRREFG